MSATTSPTPGDEELPRALGPRYELRSRLGVGGMGVVYEGRQHDTGETVAIKLLRAEYSAEELHAERFLREARAVSRIVHPNVVRILDLGRASGGELYIVMELLQGETLAAVQQREGRIAFRRVVRLGVQLCRALGAAHDAGIVHRDLKMSNVLIVANESDPEFVKVFDFGVAKIADEIEANLTRSGVLVGTPDCMAPEQIEGGAIDARTDVYALGVLLYRALSGTPLFAATGLAAMVNSHLNVAPDSLLTRAPTAGIPPALDAVVQRCLQKRPGSRFATMADVEEALLESIEGTASGAPPMGRYTPSAPELDTAHRARPPQQPGWSRPEPATIVVDRPASGEAARTAPAFDPSLAFDAIPDGTPAPGDTGLRTVPIDDDPSALRRGGLVGLVVVLVVALLGGAAALAVRAGVPISWERLLRELPARELPARELPARELPAPAPQPAPAKGSGRPAPRRGEAATPHP